MTKITIKKMLIHNFLSFKDEEWDFDNTSKLVLVKGINKDTESQSGTTSNGSGKSAWSHALMFSLFGQLVGKIHNSNIKNKYSDDVLNGYKMFVDIEVDTIHSKSNVKHWKIIRGLQKTQAIVLQLFSLNEGGEWIDISKSSSANTQKFIEDNVILMNFEMYQRLVMLSTDDKYNFFNLNAAQKREFVETMFDTSIYSTMYKMMVEDFKSRNMVVQNLKVNKIKLEKTKELCEDEIEKYKTNVNGMISESEDEKAKIQKQVDGFDSRFSELDKRKEVISESLTRIQDNKKKLEDAMSSLNESITSNRIETTNFNSTISHHERELNKHKEVLGMICDDCKSIVNKFYSLDLYRNEIESLKIKIVENENTISQLTGKIDKIKIADDKLNASERQEVSKMNEVQIDERNLKFQKTQLTNSILNLEKRIFELKESIDDENKIPSYSIYKDTLKKMDEVEKELKNETTTLCLLKIGSDIVSPESIRKNIISKVVDSINSLINANLEELCVGFKCHLTQDMNDFEIVSKGGELDFPNLSLGERMKLIISSQLAFRKFLESRFNLSVNIMIIDEVVDRALDSVSIQKLLGMLLQLSQRENMNISIISHRGEVEEMFNNIPETQLMIVQKENNISTIVRN